MMKNNPSEEKLFDWEIDRLKSNVSRIPAFSGNHKIDFGLFVFVILVLSLTFSSICSNSIIAHWIDPGSSVLLRTVNVTILMFCLALLYFVFKRIRLHLDLLLVFKKYRNHRIKKIFDFKYFRILVLKPWLLFILNKKMPYYYSISEGQEFVSKRTRTLKLLDFFVKDEQVSQNTESSENLISGTFEFPDQAIKDKNQEFDDNGFLIFEQVYSEAEIKAILSLIEKTDGSYLNEEKSSNIILTRAFLQKVPEIKTLIYNQNFKRIFTRLFDSTYFACKSIYFNKPEHSNFGLIYHQDRVLMVNKRIELDGYDWRYFGDDLAALGPKEIIEKAFSIRIHLDDTNENNGALRIIEGSHLKGIVTARETLENGEKEVLCSVNRGGIMIMKSLLMHSSSQTTSDKKRRVIHIEYCNQELPQDLIWVQREELDFAE